MSSYVTPAGTGTRRDPSRLPVRPPDATPALARAASTQGHRPRPTEDAAAGDERPDRVYEASVDSFPASDPPSWGALRVGDPSRTRRLPEEP